MNPHRGGGVFSKGVVYFPVLLGHGISKSDLGHEPGCHDSYGCKTTSNFNTSVDPDLSETFLDTKYSSFFKSRFKIIG